MELSADVAAIIAAGLYLASHGAALLGKPSWVARIKLLSIAFDAIVANYGKAKNKQKEVEKK